MPKVQERTETDDAYHCRTAQEKVQLVDSSCRLRRSPREPGKRVNDDDDGLDSNQELGMRECPSCFPYIL